MLECLINCDRRDEAAEWLDAMRDPHARMYPSPLASTYNVLIKDSTRRCAHPDDVENVLTAMANDGVSPSAATIDNIINFHIRMEDPQAAVTAIQDMFTQYGARPTPPTFVYLLAGLLAAGDHYEARRAVFVLNQLWPLDEETQTRPSNMLSQTELAHLFATYDAEIDFRWAFRRQEST